MKKVFIEGGTIVNSKESFVGNILIEGEKIKKVLKPDDFINFKLKKAKLINPKLYAPVEAEEDDDEDDEPQQNKHGGDDEEDMEPSMA